jgi:hypothetical protein
MSLLVAGKSLLLTMCTSVCYTVYRQLAALVLVIALVVVCNTAVWLLRFVIAHIAVVSRDSDLSCRVH